MVVPRWFVMPIETMLSAPAPAFSRTPRAAESWELHISFRALFHPAGPRVDLSRGPGIAGYRSPACVKENRPRTGCALIKRQYAMFHIYSPDWLQLLLNSMAASHASEPPHHTSERRVDNQPAERRFRCMERHSVDNETYCRMLESVHENGG